MPPHRAATDWIPNRSKAGKGRHHDGSGSETMKTTPLRSLIVEAVLMLGLAVPAVAQVQRGSVYGTVRDGTGAVLPGVVVQLTSEITAPREAISENRGVFRFPDLDP